jgi:hypothetical protein
VVQRQGSIGYQAGRGCVQTLPNRSTRQEHPPRTSEAVDIAARYLLYELYDEPEASQGQRGTHS